MFLFFIVYRDAPAPTNRRTTCRPGIGRIYGYRNRKMLSVAGRSGSRPMVFGHCTVYISICVRCD